MKFLGLKLKKWAQWLAVLKAEGRRVDWRSMARLAIEGISRRNRKRWRLRMRSCGRCPLYLHLTRQCDLCKCFMPLKALNGSCAAKEANPDGSIGWPTELL